MSGPHDPGVGRAWYEHHENLALLFYWLEERGDAPNSPGHFMAEPWAWGREWLDMRAELAEVERAPRKAAR